MALLTARERTLSQLFTPSYKFRIPHFQRPYAWTEEETGKLLSDLAAASLNAPSQMADAAPYFLGTIVIVKQAGAPDAYVVDGQQRLTTATILLAVLRDMDIGLTARLQPHILFSGENEGPLTPRKADVEFFRERFQKPRATLSLAEEDMLANPAQEKMIANALHLRRELEKMEPAERTRLADFILDRCILVEVCTSDDDRAYQVFEVMNSRGLDLKETDVLKAELIGATPQDLRSFYADRWEDLEASLGEEAFFQLFGHIRMIHRPGKAQKAMISEVREALDPVADPQGFIEGLLLVYGRVFKELTDAKMRLPSRSDEANRLLRALNRLTNKDWIPPAIAFFTQTNRNADEAVAFLTELERMAYGLFVQSGDENLRISRYKNVIKTIRDGASVDRILATLDLTEKDKKFCREVLNGALYNKERIRRIVLIRLDELLAGPGRGIDYDMDNVTVEHVLPRRPEEGSAWIRDFPSAKERDRLVNKLGNLTLLSRRRNNAAGNYDFETKKQQYLAKDGVTPFALTTDILKEPVWTPEALLRRHQIVVRAGLRDLASVTGRRRVGSPAKRRVPRPTERWAAGRGRRPTPSPFTLASSRVGAGRPSANNAPCISAKKRCSGSP